MNSLKLWDHSDDRLASSDCPPSVLSPLSFVCIPQRPTEVSNGIILDQGISAAVPMLCQHGQEYNSCYKLPFSLSFLPRQHVFIICSLVRAPVRMHGHAHIHMHM